MKIAPTPLLIAPLVFIGLAAFGGGVALGNLTAEPEVVTISQDVPTACADAAQAGFDTLSAGERVEQYETEAEVLASRVTLSALAADASLIEDALRPIAEQNEKEDEWRGKRDDARATFNEAANKCLDIAAAAEAAHGR